MAIDNAVQKKLQTWLDGPYDEETKAFIRSKKPEDLIDAFYTDLSFGTGGLRGIMGVGTNRMNRYTVQMATQGLANYILKQKESHPSVLIGYDSRHNSLFFAEETARVLAANGITAYLLNEMRPTPYISFATRHLKCTSGIMITASHNSAIYNGYKVYWKDGAQVVSPHDTGIMDEVHAIHSIADVKLSPLNDPLIKKTDVGPLDQEYLSALRLLQLFPEENKKNGKSLNIVYTSLHGTGITTCPAALKDWGFTSIHYVEAQIKPDGDFPTVKFPNPEYKEALQMGIDLLVQTNSDLLIANDPDADRMGIVVMHHNTPIILTGNQIATLCVHYLSETLTSQNAMPLKGAFITTIVSTELQKIIASHYKKPCFEVLTGFKYIGEKIHLWELGKDGAYEFLFGAEESYGFLRGTHARDKDATISSCLISEIALSAKSKGKTLVDVLNEIYKQFGLFKEKQLSVNFDPGKEGMEKMLQVMNTLRKNPPQSILEKKVIQFTDYEKGNDGLPPSDVLLFRLSDKSKLIIRPSGTEPKIKIYAEVQGESATDEYLDTLLLNVKKLCSL
ncbi:MAG: phospho-sugar mutase [Chlamydiota bacterium]